MREELNCAEWVGDYDPHDSAFVAHGLTLITVAEVSTDSTRLLVD